MALKKESIDLVKQKASLIDIVSEFTELKRHNQSFVGLCPFHEEKTPSFTIKAGESHFHCFGCGAHGDVFDFLQKHKGLSLPDAAEMLASWYKITLERTDKEEYKPTPFDLLRRIEDFYHFYLLNTEDGKEALNYLNERSISLDDIERFGIGLVPRKEQSNKFIKSLNANAKDLGILDTFEGRIAFPIKDNLGRTIAFSCRNWKKEHSNPKYINSSETSWFKKSSILYGLDLSRQRITKERTVILTEGQIDVIRLISVGLALSVAPLGSSFSSEHAAVLKRLGIERAYLCFDGDKAGREATLKAGILLQGIGIEPFVVEMPEGEDCDSFIREQGIEPFRELLSNSKLFIHFMASYFEAKHGVTPNGKMLTCQDCIKVIDSWSNPILVQESKRNLANVLGLTERVVFEVNLNKDKFSFSQAKNALNGEKMALNAIFTTEHSFLLFSCLEESDFETPICKKVFSFLKTHHLTGKTIDDSIAELEKNELKSIVSCFLGFSVPDDIKQIVTSLKRDVYLSRLDGLRKKLKLEMSQNKDFLLTLNEIKSIERALDLL